MFVKKRMILLALSIAPILGWAQDSTFKMQGKIGDENAPAKAYLVYGVAGKRVVDSAILDHGKFQFKGTLVEPTNAQLTIDHRGTGLPKQGQLADAAILFLEKGTIKINGIDSVAKASITGSKLNDEYKKYLAAIKPQQNEMASADAQYGVASAAKNQAVMDSLVKRYNKALEQKKDVQFQFVKQNTGSFLSLLVLMELGGEHIDPATIEPIYKSFAPAILQTPTGRNFGKSIAIARATAVGEMAPAFTQNDVNDKPVSLAEFRGKYVLLDFWASWCGPCRRENPNVVKAYNEYKNKNFTVLGVSLDRPGKKADWLAAIAKDGLDWTQVSDLQYGDNAVAKLYGVSSIPQNFLIDPDGKIIAKNLRGEELAQKLKALFN